MDTQLEHRMECQNFSRWSLRVESVIDFVLFFAMFSGFVRLLDFFLFLIYGGVSNDSADGDAGGGEMSLWWVEVRVFERMSCQ